MERGESDQPNGRVRGGWPLSLAIQFLLIGGAILLYFEVRGLTEGNRATAIAHAEEVLRLESHLRLDVETRIQDLVLDHDGVVRTANWVYIWGHWPVIVATLVWLFARHRNDYLLLRNAMFISGAIGLVIFATFPVAPPRLLPGFVDTVTASSKSYRVLQPSGLVNKYAAMPSLHFGWNLLVGIVIYRVARTRMAQVYAIVGPMLMGAAVVITANHFVLDAVVGGSVALIGLIAALLLPVAVDRNKRRLSTMKLPAPNQRGVGSWLRRRRPSGASGLLTLNRWLTGPGRDDRGDSETSERRDD